MLWNIAGRKDEGLLSDVTSVFFEMIKMNVMQNNELNS